MQEGPEREGHAGGGVRAGAGRTAAEPGAEMSQGQTVDGKSEIHNVKVNETRAGETSEHG